MVTAVITPALHVCVFIAGGRHLYYISIVCYMGMVCRKTLHSSGPLHPDTTTIILPDLKTNWRQRIQNMTGRIALNFSSVHLCVSAGLDLKHPSAYGRKGLFKRSFQKLLSYEQSHIAFWQQVNSYNRSAVLSLKSSLWHKTFEPCSSSNYA